MLVATPGNGAGGNPFTEQPTRAPTRAATPTTVGVAPGQGIFFREGGGGDWESGPPALHISHMRVHEHILEPVCCSLVSRFRY